MRLGICLLKNNQIEPNRIIREEKFQCNHNYLQRVCQVQKRLQFFTAPALSGYGVYKWVQTNSLFVSVSVCVSISVSVAFSRSLSSVLLLLSITTLLTLVRRFDSPESIPRLLWWCHHFQLMCFEFKTITRRNMPTDMRPLDESFALNFESDIDWTCIDFFLLFIVYKRKSVNNARQSGVRQPISSTFLLTCKWHSQKRNGSETKKKSIDRNEIWIN